MLDLELQNCGDERHTPTLITRCIRVRREAVPAEGPGDVVFGPGGCVGLSYEGTEIWDAGAIDERVVGHGWEVNDDRVGFEIFVAIDLERAITREDYS